MVLEEERRREGIDSMILEAVTGPPEQVAPCIRNALEVRETRPPGPRMSIHLGHNQLT